MIESYVDLAYRGLPLQRRVKLSQVRPSNGYLELPVPMPVGTKIAISTDEGVTLDAIVVWVHEQVGGSDKTPGMRVAPSFDVSDPSRGDAEPARSWWKARVALPELEVEVVRQRKPPDEGPTIVAPPIHVGDVADDGRSTTVMEAVDPAILEELMNERPSGEHRVIDDGKQTTAMDSVDPAALGLDPLGQDLGQDSQVGDDLALGQDSQLEAGSSGPMSAADPAKPAGTGTGPVRKRRKRR